MFHVTTEQTELRRAWAARLITLVAMMTALEGAGHASPALIQSDAFCLPDDLVKRAPRFSPLSQGRRRSAVESLVPGWPGHTRGTGARVGPPAAWPLSVGGLHHGARSRTGGRAWWRGPASQLSPSEGGDRLDTCHPTSRGRARGIRTLSPTLRPDR